MSSPMGTARKLPMQLEAYRRTSRRNAFTHGAVVVPSLSPVSFCKLFSLPTLNPCYKSQQQMHGAVSNRLRVVQAGFSELHLVTSVLS